MEKKLQPGIYVHLPFCSVHCVYCDFPISTRLSLSERYYRALLRELHGNSPTETADTLYFGGGTPSLAPTEVLSSILSSAPLEQSAEITLEVNPDHVTAQKLFDWKSLGINRLSLGVQSLENDVLRMMLRQHSPEGALEAFRLARSSGFENLNVDLILGFPKQTVSGFLSGLQTLLELRPDHFSIYLLESHDGAPLQKILQSGRAVLMDEAAQVDCFEIAIDTLKEAGYLHYEVSNFAMKQKPSLHNLKYWTDAPYFGYGAGACSYLGFNRIRNIPDVAKYIDSIEKDQSAVEETIRENEEIRARNALVFGLRKTGGIHIERFHTRYGRSPAALFGEELENHIASGFLEVSRGSLRLTRKGMLLSNEVLSSAIS